MHPARTRMHVQDASRYYPFSRGDNTHPGLTMESYLRLHRHVVKGEWIAQIHGLCSSSTNVLKRWIRELSTEELRCSNQMP
eukprot:1144055-Pelagomonas_calceolata.AAC.2